MAPHERDHAQQRQAEQTENNNFTHADSMIHMHT